MQSPVQHSTRSPRPSSLSEPEWGEASLGQPEMPPTEVFWLRGQRPLAASPGRVYEPSPQYTSSAPPAPYDTVLQSLPPQPPTCCRGHHAATSITTMRGHMSPRWGHPATVTPVASAAWLPAPGSLGVPELLGAPGPGCCGLAVPSCDCGHGSASPQPRPTPPQQGFVICRSGPDPASALPYTGIGHSGAGWAETLLGGGQRGCEVGRGLQGLLGGEGAGA